MEEATLRTHNNMEDNIKMDLTESMVECGLDSPGPG